MFSPGAESGYNGENSGRSKEHSLLWLRAEANANPGLFRPPSHLILEVVPRDPTRDAYLPDNMQGLMGGHWRRVEIGRSCWLFFRYDAKARTITFAGFRCGARLDFAQNFAHGLKTHTGFNQANNERVSKEAQDDHEVAEMKTAAQTTFAERLGRMLGRAWRGCVHLDRRAQGWLRVQGWAPGAAKATLLVVKLVALGLLLYAAFWLALLLLFLVAAAWTARTADWDDEPEPEWRTGADGFGLYRGDVRIDIGDPHEDGQE